MTRYILPDEAVRGIAPIGKLTPKSAVALAGELQSQLQLAFSFSDEVRRIVDTSLAVEGEGSTRRKLAEAILGIHYIKHGLGKPNDEVVEEVMSSVEDVMSSDEARREAMSLSGIEPALFRNNILLFLNVQVLQAAVKSWALRTEHENIFFHSKIFTDVRPVFNDDLNAPLLASLLTHTIKLSFQRNGQQEAFFLVADSEDLRDLQSCIERALEKAKALSHLISGHIDGFGPALDQDSK